MLVSDLKLEDGTYDGTFIKVKPYLSFVEKKLLVIDILETCLISDDNDMLSCDYFMKKLLRDIKIIVNYTDIEFQDETMKDYDFLCENKILDEILDKMEPSELQFIDWMLEDELQQRLKVVNSLAGVLASRLNLLISKIPSEKSIKKIMNDIPKQINKIKPENMSIIKDIIKQDNKVN